LTDSGDLITTEHTEHTEHTEYLESQFLILVRLRVFRGCYVWKSLVLCQD